MCMKIQIKSIGLSPVPDKSNIHCKILLLCTHTALSASTDESSIPERFENVIIERAKYYAFTLRGEVQTHNLHKCSLRNQSNVCV